MSKTEHKQTAQKRTKSRIPKFRNVEEAAEFWDSHSLADFEDELVPVEDVKFLVMSAGPKRPITVRLPEDTLQILTEKAHQMGVGPSTLVRIWVIEHLTADRNGSRQSNP